MLAYRLSSYRVYLIASTTAAFFFTLYGTLSSVYRFQTVGLSPLQLILVGTVLELSVFLFEVPTGIVADLYSRRRSVVIGFLTIFSLNSQADAFGQIAGGPLLGLVANVSLRGAFGIAGLLLLPATLLYVGLLRRREDLGVSEDLS